MPFLTSSQEDPTSTMVFTVEQKVKIGLCGLRQNPTCRCADDIVSVTMFIPVMDLPMGAFNGWGAIPSTWKLEKLK